MSNSKNGISSAPKFELGDPEIGQYADEEWQPEHSDVIRCPDCGGPVQFKDWETHSGLFVATHYRCNDCRINWWADA